MLGKVFRQKIGIRKRKGTKFGELLSKNMIAIFCLEENGGC